MPRSPQKSCPVCNSTDTSLCITLGSVPVYCNVLYPTRDESLSAPRGDITLMFCRCCGHLYNGTFDPQKIDYTLEYENSLHYSPRFQEYADNLAEDLVGRHNLRGKTIVEIACGKGDFLSQLCSMGDNRGIGFDPSYEPGRHGEKISANITFIQDYYSDKYADIDADLVCCRHALEHIESPGEFLNSVRSAIGDRRGTVLYFEVPNSLFTLRDLGIWDIIYEHCGYFCQNSLERAFNESGFVVNKSLESFGKQFLSLEAVPADGKSGGAHCPDSVDDISKYADTFEKEYSDTVSRWKAQLDTFREENRSVAVWGAGSKGVTFLNVLGAGDEIGCIVDLNPHKQGKYLPGTGHEVVAPAYLKEYQPDIVIVMNRIYADEIGRSLNDLQVDSELVVV